MLAGHVEGGGGQSHFANGEATKLDNGNFMPIMKNVSQQFYGMSSKTANNKHFEGLKDYRSSEELYLFQRLYKYNPKTS